MKAKKFLNKTINAIEDALQKENISNDYTIYWIVNNKIPIISIMYPDETIKKYDLEFYRLKHKESDCTFKNIAEEITEMIMDDIKKNSMEKNADADIPEVFLDETQLARYLTNYINQNKKTIIPFYSCITENTVFMEYYFTINGKVSPVIIPDFNTIKPDVEYIPFIPLDRAMEQYQIEFENNTEQYCSYKLGAMILPKYKALLPNPALESVKDSLRMRFLEKNTSPWLRSHKVLSGKYGDIYSQLSIKTDYGYIDLNDYLFFSMSPWTQDKTNKETLEMLEQIAQKQGDPFCTVLTGGAVGITGSNMSGEYFQAYSFLHNKFVNDYIREYAGDEVIIFPTSVHECIAVEKKLELYNTFYKVFQESQNRLPESSRFTDQPLLYNLVTGELSYFEGFSKEVEKEEEDELELD